MTGQATWTREAACAGLAAGDEMCWEARVRDGSGESWEEVQCCCKRILCVGAAARPGVECQLDFGQVAVSAGGAERGLEGTGFAAAVESWWSVAESVCAVDDFGLAHANDCHPLPLCPLQ